MKRSLTSQSLMSSHHFANRKHTKIYKRVEGECSAGNGNSINCDDTLDEYNNPDDDNEWMNGKQEEVDDKNDYSSDQSRHLYANGRRTGDNYNDDGDGYCGIAEDIQAGPVRQDVDTASEESDSSEEDNSKDDGEVSAQAEFKDEEGDRYNSDSDNSTNHSDNEDAAVQAAVNKYDSNTNTMELSDSDDDNSDNNSEDSSMYFNESTSSCNDLQDDDAEYTVEGAIKIFNELNESRKVADRQQFDFMRVLVPAIRLRKEFNYPSDALVPFIQSGNNNKKEFSQQLNSILRRHQVKAGLELELLTMLEENIPQAQLPLHTTKKKKKKSTIKNYQPPDIRNYPFDICPQGCCAFAGADERLMRCDRCKAERFRPCTRPICKDKVYDDCTHTVKTKIGYKQLYYKALIPTIIALLETDGFLLALNYKHRNYRKNSNEEIKDISDGTEAKSAMKDMKARFTTKKMTDSTLNNAITPIYLLLGEFYDGAQVHKSKSSDFWALFITILNLPPSYRNKAGVGMFLNALFTSKTSTIAEDFLFTELLVKELQTLEVGISISVQQKSYFVQARLISHSLDTKALEKVARLQAVNASAGCPLCFDMFGTHRQELGKCYYGGHRRFLSIDHPLRYFGQSQTCCPSEFFSGQEDVEKKELSASSCVVAKVPLLVRANETSCCNDYRSAADADVLNNILRKRVFKQSNYAPMNHPNLEIDVFKASLFYPHGDLRTPKNYERKNDEFLLNNAAAAIKAKKPCGGVSGVWPFALLRNVRIDRQLCYDPFHALANILKQLLQCIKGERLSAKVRQYCKKYNVHPRLADSSGELATLKSKIIAAIWVLKKSAQKRIDAWFNALIVPVGFVGDYAINNVLNSTGQLKGSAAITALTAFMEYMIEAMGNSMPPAYKAYMSSLSQDMRELCSVVFSSKDELSPLWGRVVETTCLHEGLFPDMDATLVNHQPVDLVMHIRRLGPFRGWWGFAGERLIALLKNMVPKGGLSIDKTVINRYSAFEHQRTADAYDFDIDNIQDFARLSGYKKKLQLSMNSVDIMNIITTARGSQRLEYSDASFSMAKPNKLPIRLECAELESLCMAMINEIEKQCISAEAALHESPLYRLYRAYLVHKRTREFKGWYSDWLNAINTMRTTGNASNNFLYVDEFEADEFYDRHLISKRGVNHNLYEDVLQRGDIYEADCKAAVAVIAFAASLNTYKRALVYGVIFRSRGVECRETELPERVQSAYGQQQAVKQIPVKECNILKNNWSKKWEYSSWCRFRHVNASDKRFNGDVNGTLNGQINFFFYVNIPEEKLLHGVPFVSICARKYVGGQSGKINKVLCDDSMSFLPDVRFTACTNMIATPVCITGFDTENKPILISRTMIAKEEKAIKKSKDAKLPYSEITDRSEISHLILSDLLPSRQKLKFYKENNSYYNKSD